MPAGTYWAMGFFPTITRTSSSLRMVVVPQFTVHASTRIHLAARAASSELGASTPRPSVLQGFSLNVVRTGLYGPAAMVGVFGSSGSSLWVSPTTVKPSVGSLHTYQTQILASPPDAAGPPYAYTLAFAGPAGIIPDQHAVIRQRSLATVTERFYQEFTSTGAVYTAANYSNLNIGIGVPQPVGLPCSQTQYMTGSTAVAYQTFYSQFLRSIGGEQSSASRTLRAGQRLSEAWNNYPLHPQPAVQALHGRLATIIPQQPSAFRMGDKLMLSPFAFSDNVFGHTGNGFFGFRGLRVKLTGSYAVYENGVKVAHGSTATRHTFDAPRRCG